MGFLNRLKMVIFNAMFRETDYWTSLRIRSEITKLSKLVNLPDMPMQSVESINNRIDVLKRQYNTLTSRKFPTYERFELRIARYFR